MTNNNWSATFTIVDQTSGTKSMASGASGTDNSFGAGTSEPAMLVPRASEKSFVDGAMSRAKSQAVRTVLTPLNAATGGAAGQVYNIGKAVAMGSAAAIGTAGVMAAIWAIQKTVNAIQERIAKNEAKAAEANELDNLLMRAGSKNYVTQYTGNFGGVRSTNRR